MPTGTRSVWEDKPFHECRNEGALGTSKWEHRFKGHFQMLGSKWFQSYSLPSYAIPCQCRSSRAVRRALAALSEQPRMCLWHLRSKTWPDSRSLWRGLYTSLFDPNAKSSSLGTHKNAHREMFMKVKWKHNCAENQKRRPRVSISVPSDGLESCRAPAAQVPEIIWLSQEPPNPMSGYMCTCINTCHTQWVASSRVCHPFPQVS